MSRSGPGGDGGGLVRYLVTCEHGGNRVPPRHRALFRGAEGILASHRGWDPGALPLARQLARGLGAPLRFSLTTRLLVDLNRSEGNPSVFSEFSRRLPPAEQARLLRLLHRPYRGRVQRLAAEGTPACPLVHLSVHTFTPVWKGHSRSEGIGVLFDPRRGLESWIATRWIRHLRREAPEVEVAENRPYAGTDDGLTTSLRTLLPGDRYVGLELELRQDLVRTPPSLFIRTLRAAVTERPT